MKLMWGDKTLEQAEEDGDVIIHDVNVEAEKKYMTLAEAEKRRPDLLTCRFMDLLMLEARHISYLAEEDDDEVAESLEVVRLIKEARMGNGERTKKIQS